MKRAITVSATILTFLISTAALARPGPVGHGMGPDLRVERMTENLDLTAEQQAEIRAILEARQAQRRAERAAVRQRIDAVMTEEQRAKRDAQIDRRLERRAARIADHLDLAPEQEATLRDLMAGMRTNPEWTPGDMREQLSRVLTDTQLAELNEVRSFRGRHHGSGCTK